MSEGGQGTFPVRNEGATGGTSKPSTKLLLALSEDIPTEWYVLGIHLDLEPNTLDGIRDDNRFAGLKDKAFKMLRLWTQRKGEDATIQVLADALEQAKRQDLVKWLWTQGADQHHTELQEEHKTKGGRSTKKRKRVEATGASLEVHVRGHSGIGRDGETLSELSVERVMVKAADMYFERKRKKRDPDNFVSYLREVRKLIVGSVEPGSLRITVRCTSLGILEDLWQAYTSGELNEAAQKYLITDEVLKQHDLRQFKLVTVIDEGEYRRCKEELTQLEALIDLTAPHLPTIEGNTEISRALVEKGADVDARNEDGLLTDLSRVKMAYVYWRNGKTKDEAVSDLFFRRNPFAGEFTVFAGLEACLEYVKNFSITESDIAYLKTVLPHCIEEEFYLYLRNIETDGVTLCAIPEGSVVFPRVPLIRLEGPLPVVQLMETTLLTLVNYASLIATNAARLRLAAGWDKTLLEFGVHRAQGPDGGLSASKYCYVGGFDGTTNTLAGKLYGIPVKGALSHAFVTSFGQDDDVVGNLRPADSTQEPRAFFPVVRESLKKVVPVLKVLNEDQVNQGELCAFAAYAVSFPNNFLALVDTYDVFRSGIPSYCAVGLALHSFGYKPRGIRLDSGDLAYLSLECRERFKRVSEAFGLSWFAKTPIVASNDINEDTLFSLNQQGHSIDSFGIGTHLVTCQKQPALGCVFELVELNGEARFEFSHDVEKVTTPGKKEVYRLYGSDDCPLLDLLTRASEPAPSRDKRVLCRHPFDEAKRAYASPSRVEYLYKVYWRDGKLREPLPSLEELQDHVKKSLKSLRRDHLRSLNPTPYKVSLSDELYEFMHKLWLKQAPIGELC